MLYKNSYTHALKELSRNVHKNIVHVSNKLKPKCSPKRMDKNKFWNIHIGIMQSWKETRVTCKENGYILGRKGKFYKTRYNVKSLLMFIYR